jgi:hypothetical protein
MMANIEKYGQYGALMALLTLLSGCFNPPSFPDAPEIAFKSLSGVRTVDPLGNPQDSITVTISFRDGDGDLGLDANDTLPPFQAFTTDADGNRVANFFHHNYHLKVKRMKDGQAEEVQFLDGGRIKGRFPVLIDNQGPIEGELNFGRYFLISGSGNTFNNFDTLFFEVQIVDRQRNVSNTITTPTIVLGDF